MDKKQVFSIIFVVWFVSMTILAGYFIIMMRNESTACLKNPFVYEAKKLKEANKAEISCSCNIVSASFVPTLYFNDVKQWWGDYPIGTNSLDGGFNASKLNFTLK